MENKDEELVPPKREDYEDNWAFAKACSDYPMKRNAEVYRRLADK